MSLSTTSSRVSISDSFGDMNVSHAAVGGEPASSRRNEKNINSTTTNIAANAASAVSSTTAAPVTTPLNLSPPSSKPVVHNRAHVLDGLPEDVRKLIWLYIHKEGEEPAKRLRRLHKYALISTEHYSEMKEILNNDKTHRLPLLHTRHAFQRLVTKNPLDPLANKQITQRIRQCGKDYKQVYVDLENISDSKKRQGVRPLAVKTLGHIEGVKYIHLNCSRSPAIATPTAKQSKRKLMHFASDVKTKATAVLKGEKASNYDDGPELAKMIGQQLAALAAKGDSSTGITLEFRGQDFEKAVIPLLRQLASVVDDLPGLEVLDVSWPTNMESVDKASVEEFTGYLATVISKAKSLHTLKIPGIYSADENTEGLAAALAENKTLKYLSD